MTIYDDVRNWARDRGILAAATPQAQWVKCSEELAEFREAYANYRSLDEDSEKIMQVLNALRIELGDLLVTLIILAALNGDKVEAWFSDNPIRKRIFGDDITDAVLAIAPHISRNRHSTAKIANACELIGAFCDRRSISVIGCLKSAYAKISDRDGETIDGVFVKASDLNA